MTTDGPERGHYAAVRHHLLSGRTRELLLHALCRLPEDLCEAVVLRDVDQLPCAEISMRLGVPVAVVKTRVNQARLALFRQLQTWSRN